MDTLKLIRLLTIIKILKKCIGIAKVEIKYNNKESTIPLEVTKERINQIIKDENIEFIKLIIKL